MRPAKRSNLRPRHGSQKFRLDSRCPGRVLIWRSVNNSEWTAAGDAVACLLLMSARNNRIFHIDGDSFFASCEIALDPKLEGRPVWVAKRRVLLAS